MTARRGTDLHPWEGALEEGDASGEPLTLPKVMGQMSAEEDRVLELQAMAEQQDGYIPPHGVVVVCKALLAYAALEIRARQAVEISGPACVLRGSCGAYLSHTCAGVERVTCPDWRPVADPLGAAVELLRPKGAK